MTTLRIAIVGLGPWGLCVLERLLSRFRQLDRSKTQLAIFAIDVRSPGPGVHATTEPSYLLLNTVAGQISLFAAADRDGCTNWYGGKSFLDWTRDEGYRIVRGECVQSSEGRDIEPEDFLPRAVLGRYLEWTYRQLTSSLPEGARFEHLRSEAVDLISTPEGSERLRLADGRWLDVDHVFLTTGHTRNTLEDERVVGAYPVDDLQRRVPRGTIVAVAGMGLVGVDVITSLTVGRGGRFVRHGAQLCYVPSGSEPSIRLYSRNGLCFRCRPHTTRDQTGDYVPAFLTSGRIAELRRRAMSTRRNAQLDFESEIFPLLWAEIALLYWTEQQRHQRGPEHARRVRRELIAAWHEGRFDAARNRLGKFDPQSEFFRPDLNSCVDHAAYQRAVRDELEADLEDSRRGEHGSPRKAAFELFRVLRNSIREIVDHSGLTPASFRFFRRHVAGPINRIIVGPPLQRGEELLALMDAGIVTIPFGRAPRVEFESQSGLWRISSTRLHRSYSERVDRLITGHLEQPTVETSSSALLRGLYERGRLQPFDRSTLCGVRLDPWNRVVNVRGDAEPRLWVLGPLADGVRYFNHYVPSPKSRFRAFQDADQCIRRIFDAAPGDGAT